MAFTSIKGYSRYRTDGRRVYRGSAVMRPTVNSGKYHLINDENKAEFVEVEYALSGGKKGSKVVSAVVKLGALKKKDLLAIAEKNNIVVPNRATVPVIRELIKHLLNGGNDGSEEQCKTGARRSSKKRQRATKKSPEVTPKVG